MSDVRPLAKAQAALGEAALHLLEVLEAQEVAKAAIPLPPDLADRLEGRRPTTWRRISWAPSSA